MSAQFTENALLDKWLSARMVGLGPDEACELIDQLKESSIDTSEVESRVRAKVDAFLEEANGHLRAAGVNDVEDEDRLSQLRELLEDGIDLDDCWDPS